MDKHSHEIFKNNEVGFCWMVLLLAVALLLAGCSDGKESAAEGYASIFVAGLLLSFLGNRVPEGKTRANPPPTFPKPPPPPAPPRKP